MWKVQFVVSVGQIPFWEPVRLSGPCAGPPCSFQFFASCWRYPPDAHILSCSSSRLWIPASRLCILEKKNQGSSLHSSAPVLCSPAKWEHKLFAPWTHGLPCLEPLPCRENALWVYGKHQHTLTNREGPSWNNAKQTLDCHLPWALMSVLTGWTFYSLL